MDLGLYAVARHEHLDRAADDPLFFFWRKVVCHVEHHAREQVGLAKLVELLSGEFEVVDLNSPFSAAL